MKTALVLMTILGCDDSVTDCRHVATLQQRWTSVELCDAESEKQLGNFANASYPVVVAVCQIPEEQKDLAATDTQPPAATAATPLPVEEEQSLTKRAISRVSKILPSTEGVKQVLGAPVRMVEESYSWVARRFTQ